MSDVCDGTFVGTVRGAVDRLLQLGTMPLDQQKPHVRQWPELGWDGIQVARGFDQLAAALAELVKACPRPRLESSAFDEPPEFTCEADWQLDRALHDAEQVLAALDLSGTDPRPAAAGGDRRPGGP
jgi:hypothetical protein